MKKKNILLKILLILLLFLIIFITFLVWWVKESKYNNTNSINSIKIEINKENTVSTGGVARINYTPLVRRGGEGWVKNFSDRDFYIYLKDEKGVILRKSYLKKNEVLKFYIPKNFKGGEIIISVSSNEVTEGEMRVATGSVTSKCNLYVKIK